MENKIEIAEYNPLDLVSLGESIVNALTAGPLWDFPPEKFHGAGIYAIYYQGKFAPYRDFISLHKMAPGGIPIYIGKAAPAGSRKGGLGLQKNAHRTGRQLSSRLSEHADSINQAENLNIADFKFRALIVDSTWLGLAESTLIKQYQSLWNSAVDGFGNHDPGAGRKSGRRTQWDELHPGREWTHKHGIARLSQSEHDSILSKVVEHIGALKSRHAERPV